MRRFANIPPTAFPLQAPAAARRRRSCNGSHPCTESRAQSPRAVIQPLSQGGDTGSSSVGTAQETCPSEKVRLHFLVTASLPFSTGSAPICPMLNARIVHETAIPEPSSTHQLRYQQAGFCRGHSRYLRRSRETIFGLVFCLTAYDRGLQPLADLACHVCVMKTAVMQDYRTVRTLWLRAHTASRRDAARVEPGRA